MVLLVWLATPTAAMIAKNQKYTIDRTSLSLLWRFGYEQGGRLDMTLDFKNNPTSPISFFLCSTDQVEQFQRHRVSELCESSTLRRSLCYDYKEVPDSSAPMLHAFYDDEALLELSAFSIDDEQAMPQSRLRLFQERPLTDQAQPQTERSWSRVAELLTNRIKQIPNTVSSYAYSAFSASPALAPIHKKPPETKRYEKPSSLRRLYKGMVYQLQRFVDHFTANESDRAQLFETKSPVLQPQSFSGFVSSMHDQVLDSLLEILSDEASESANASLTHGVVASEPEAIGLTSYTTLATEELRGRSLTPLNSTSVRFVMDPVPKTTRMHLIQLNCESIRYTMYLSYVAVNPGGEYLSTTIIPYKALYLVALLAWSLFTTAWAISWLRYHRWNTRAQMLLTIPLLLRALQSLFKLIFWRSASSKGVYDLPLYWVGFFATALAKTSSLFIFLYLAFGYGIFRSSVPEAAVRRIAMTSVMYAVGWCLYNRTMTLGLYLVAFATFLSIELCVLGLVRIVRAVQDQLVLLDQIRIAAASTPLWPKVLILARLRRIFVYLLADFFVPIWSEAFQQEGPWIGDLFDHLIHFIFLGYLCKAYLMVPFNPHLNSLAKLFHLTLPAPSVSALLTALAPRVAPGAPLWTPGVSMDPPLGGAVGGWSQHPGLRISRAAAQANLSHQLYTVNYNNGLPNPASQVGAAPSPVPAAEDPFLQDPTRFTPLPASLAVILSEREALELAPIILRNPCPCLDYQVPAGRSDDRDSLPHRGGVCPKQALGSIFSVLSDDKPLAQRAAGAINPASRQPSPSAPMPSSAAAAAGSGPLLSPQRHEDPGVVRSPRSWLGLGSEPTYHRIQDEDE